MVIFVGTYFGPSLNLPFFILYAHSVSRSGVKHDRPAYSRRRRQSTRLMRELVLETILEQPDIEIVAEIQNEDEIANAVDGMHPDFLIIALDESGRRPPLCDTLLLRYPKMKILALAPERNVSIFFLGLIRYSFQPGGSVPSRNPQHFATQDPIRGRLDVRQENIRRSTRGVATNARIFFAAAGFLLPVLWVAPLCTRNNGPTLRRTYRICRRRI